ncbi:MAG: hypothetical protein QXO40_03385 [Candidatus Aenigmatarchaeota archaeon]
MRHEKLIKFIAAIILIKIYNKQITTYQVAKKLNINFKTAYRYKKTLNSIDLEKLKNLLFS